jgi:N-acetylglucosaminyl-diphospho-decaprenol L-rhamnosyltransferase
VNRTSLDIVIVNWNTGSHLRECLNAIEQATRTHFDLGQVVVVDNASTDDSLDAVEESALPLLVVRNSVNRGFGPAANQGAAAGSSDLLLFLNPDTRVAADVIDRTVAFMVDSNNSSIGICGARMIGADGEDEFSCWRFPTFWIWVGKLTGLSYAFPWLIPMQRMTPEEVGGSGTVDQVIGAYFLIRRSLFEALSGFDERFFMYLEDVDLSLRARELGYSSYFMADAPVYHVGRVSSEQVLGRRLFYLLQSRTEYARKHWPRWQASVLALLMLVVEFPVRSVAAAVRRRPHEVRHLGEAALLYGRYLLGR